MPRIARSAKDPATVAVLLAAIAPIRKAVTDRWTNRPDLEPEDVVQETLARVWAERWRLERGALLGYAVVVARNLVTSVERREDRHRRYEHRLAEPPTGVDPVSEFLTAEESSAVSRALAALREEDRQLSRRGGSRQHLRRLDVEGDDLPDHRQGHRGDERPAVRPLEGVYAAVVHRRIVVKVRDGQVTNRVSTPRSGSLTFMASGTFSGCGRALVVRARSSECPC
jgi:hypothetical protein